MNNKLIRVLAAGALVAALLSSAVYAAPSSKELKEKQSEKQGQLDSLTEKKESVDSEITSYIEQIAEVKKSQKKVESQLRAAEAQVDEQYADANLTFHFLHNADYQNNNNIFSLWMTRDIVRGKEFILLDSDILFDPKIITRMVQEPGTALALNRHELGDEEIKVIVDGQNQVVEISKVCSIADAVGESVGIEKMDAVYSEALFAELDRMIVEEKMVNVFYEKAFERLIPQHHCFHIVDTTDFFSIELDTVEDFNSAKQLIPAELF